MRHPLFAALLGLLLLSTVPLGSGQDEGLFTVFDLKQLKFTFYPHGLGGDSETNTGSSLRIEVDDVIIEGDNAVEMRYCIDDPGDPTCRYGDLLRTSHKAGDRDGNAEPLEIDSLENAVRLGLALGAIERVARLSELLKNNITVDGKNAAKLAIVDFQLLGADGDRDLNTTIYADVAIETHYQNDKGATRHEIRLKPMHLMDEGFTYRTVAWGVSVPNEKWEFRPAEVRPASIQSKVKAEGMTSDQGSFETATDSGFLLVTEKAASSTKKKSPGFEIIGLAAGLLVAAAVVTFLILRRR